MKHLRKILPFITFIFFINFVKYGHSQQYHGSSGNSNGNAVNEANIEDMLNVMEVLWSSLTAPGGPDSKTEKIPLPVLDAMCREVKKNLYPTYIDLVDDLKKIFEKQNYYCDIPATYPNYGSRRSAGFPKNAPQTGGGMPQNFNYPPNLGISQQPPLPPYDRPQNMPPNPGFPPAPPGNSGFSPAPPAPPANSGFPQGPPQNIPQPSRAPPMPPVGHNPASPQSPARPPPLNLPQNAGPPGLNAPPASNIVSLFYRPTK